MIDWLNGWLKNDDGKIIYLLVLIMGANIIDFLFGWLNAHFNPKVVFSSSKAIYGIARKMVLFMLCVFFIPVCLLLPYPMGIGSLYVLFIGYLGSEVKSIFNHLNMTKDDKTTSNIFGDFIGKIFGSISFQSPIQINKQDDIPIDKPTETTTNRPMVTQADLNEKLKQQ